VRRGGKEGSLECNVIRKRQTPKLYTTWITSSLENVARNVVWSWGSSFYGRSASATFYISRFQC